MLSQSWLHGAWIFVLAGIILFLSLIFFPSANSARAEKRVPSSSGEVQLSYAGVVKRVAPAVVNVYSKRVVKERRSPLFNDPFFQRFFGGQMGAPRERVQQSLGSGVIVDASGLIVTNNHVIAGGTEFTVALSDRREYEA